MSLPLLDIGKFKITGETDAWLDARSRTTGKSKLEIAREALHQLAVAEIHAATLLVALTGVQNREREARGLSGEDEGRPLSEAERIRLGLPPGARK